MERGERVTGEGCGGRPGGAAHGATGAPGAAAAGGRARGRVPVLCVKNKIQY